MKKLPSVERLNELFNYNNRTGVVTWRSPPSHRVKQGDEVGGCNMGYRRVFIDNGRYYVHRIIWKLIHGHDPSGEIDHVAGDKIDNRIKVLNDVSHKENGKNNKRPKNNKSGCIGVSWSKEYSKWRAHIKVNQKQLSLGSYEDINRAICARKEAEVKYGFHENHGRF